MKYQKKICLNSSKWMGATEKEKRKKGQYNNSKEERERGALVKKKKINK